MKKFMKAIALATVLCLALSTAAFADDASKVADYEVQVVVNTDAAKVDGKQVALVIISDATGELKSTSAITDTNIKYIDQKPATAAAGATFTAPIANDVTKVAVFVGYDGASAQYVGHVDLGPDVQTIEIVSGTQTVVKAANGVGVALKVKDLPAGATKMIWAMTVGTTRRFSKPVDIAGTAGSIYYGARFVNGSNLEESSITDVGAIFLVKGSNVFTHAEDAKKEK